MPCDAVRCHCRILSIFLGEACIHYPYPFSCNVLHTEYFIVRHALGRLNNLSACAALAGAGWCLPFSSRLRLRFLLLFLLRFFGVLFLLPALLFLFFTHLSSTAWDSKRQNCLACTKRVYPERYRKGCRKTNKKARWDLTDEEILRASTEVSATGKVQARTRRKRQILRRVVSC